MQTPSPADANIAIFGRAGGGSHVIVHATAIARGLHGVLPNKGAVARCTHHAIAVATLVHAINT